jgi:hypothetical protein
MISFAEFEVALLGLLRLARFDAGFAGYFDLTRAGARRSFRLALPLLPVVFFLLHLNANWPVGTDMTRVVSAELIAYGLGWICFPLLLIFFGRTLDRESRIYGAITIYNWLSVLNLSLQLPIAVATYYGLDGGASDDLTWLVVLFVTACEFFAFWRLLGMGIAVPLALVVVEFSLSRILELTLYAFATGML